MKLSARHSLFAPARPNVGLILCGFAGLALWLIVLFDPHAAGRVLSGFIIKPTAVPNAGPIWLMLGLFVPYAAAYAFATRDPRPGDRAVIAIFAALYCHALVLRVTPMASGDLYLYVFQGRAAVFHALNPYAVIPSSVADPFVHLMGRWLANLNDTYGPLWTALATVLAGIVGDRPGTQVVAFKALAAAFFLACLPVISALRASVAGDRGDTRKDAGILLLFAWNPALLFEAAQNGHNDIVMIFFLLLATLLAVRGRFAWAGAALSASFLVKYVTLLCAPFFVAYALSRAGDGLRRRLAAAAAVVAPAVAVTVEAYAPFWFGPATLGGLFEQSSLVSIDVSSPLAFGLAYAVAGPARLFEQTTTDLVTKPAVLAFMAVTSLLVIAAFRRRRMSEREFVRFAFAPLVCYLAMASFWFMPWYLSWVAPLAVIEGAALVTIIGGMTGLLLYSPYYTAQVLGAAVVAAGTPSLAAAVAGRASSWFRRFR